MKRISVLSYNIHKGFNISNRQFILNRIKDAIRTISPDIIFLQEVIGENIADTYNINDWHSNVQFEYLADEIWNHYAYGKNKVHAKGHHGNAILSRFPIIDWENIDISTNRFERRGILHTVIETPERNINIHLLCLHLNLLESGRRMQVQKLCDRINNSVPYNEPLILAGDFNDWRERISHGLEKKVNLTEFYLKLYRHHAKTFPSFSPVLPLDRIYSRGLRIKNGERLNKAPWTQLSDHIPLYATFELI